MSEAGCNGDFRGSAAGRETCKMSGQPDPKSWRLPVAILWCKRASACNDSLWGRTGRKERHESGGHPGPKLLTLPVFPWLALKENDDSAVETEEPVKRNGHYMPLAYGQYLLGEWGLL